MRRGPPAERHLKATPARASDALARVEPRADELETLYVGLVRSYHQTVLAYVYHLVPAIQEAEDLTQDTFLRAYLALPRIGAPDNPRAWLLRIATNAALDHLRRRRLLRWVELDITGLRAGGAGPVAGLEAGEPVRRAMAALRPGDRAVLILFAHLGLCSAEVAEVLGITPTAARKRRQRARAAFTRVYERESA